MNRSRTYLTPNRHEKYMVVDGYNIINAWESLKKFINDDLDFAREKLIHLLMEYGQYEKYDITIVFDAQYTNAEENVEEKSKHCKVVYTKEKETADSYIEALAGKLQTRLTQVEVATSDGAEQWTIFSQGALRKPAWELYQDIKRAKREVHVAARQYQDQALVRRSPFSDEQLDALAKLRDDLSK